MSLFNAQTAGRSCAVAIALTCFLFSSEGFSQQAKVVKVQGRRAIVQFPDDARPRVGQIIDLSAGGTSISGGGSSNTGDRSKIIGGSAELSNLTPSGSSTSGTVFAVEGRYGWNNGMMEYGALGSLTYASSTATSLRILSVGGFFDYNLVPNTPGTEIVYGGAALGKFGQISLTTGATERSGTLMTIEVGGQLKWFPLGNTVAVRGDVLYRMESVSDTVRGFASGSGLVAKAGLYVYF